MTFWRLLRWEVRRWHFGVHWGERWGPFCGGGFPRTSVCLPGKSSRRSQVETREPQPFRASSWTHPSQTVPTPSSASTSSSLSRRTQFPKVNKIAIVQSCESINHKHCITFVKLLCMNTVDSKLNMRN